jgi:diaminopimelate epimerase
MMPDELPFYKMTGSGNDFVMLDGRTTSSADWPAERIQAVCDRRLGVGADGLVILGQEGRRVRMDFWNCDGSRADMCGNAALCSTRLAATLRLAPPEEVVLVTRAGTFPARCLPGPGEQAELHLPDFDLPARPPELVRREGESDAWLATVGVPHLVLEVADLERPDLMGRGRVLRFDAAAGPAGANVNFVASVVGPGGPRWCLRTYERGVEGETLACGTGAVAAAVALAGQGLARMPVTVETRSGRPLTIRASLAGGRATDVWLAGEGRLVFRGFLPCGSGEKPLA